jgi:L-ascorbate metabolism protein UlaG (beta-lactamase superfamily)
MQVRRIAHAGIIVTSGDTRCVMDPLFFNSFEGGTYSLAPTIEVDVEKLKNTHLDAVIISHAHLDHFSVKSLNLINRDAFLIHPEGDSVIDFCARWMGFQNVKSLKPYEKIKIGEIDLMATPSEVPFPEMGMIFSAQDQTFWNMVDSVVTRHGVTEVRKHKPKIDLLFAKYQPMIELELRTDALGSEFPAAYYDGLLKTVKDIAPKIVVPTACGFKATEYLWINDRQFPVTAEKFMSDVAEIIPGILTADLEPGDSIDVKTGDLVKNRNSFLSVKEKFEGYAWRPDRGVPPLVETRPLKIEEACGVERFLTHDFLKFLTTSKSQPWVNELRVHKIKWRLEVIGRETQARLLDFARHDLCWSNDTGEFVHLHTSVTASAIHGLLTGELSLSAVVGGGMLRTFRRLYEPRAEGGKILASLKENPLIEVLAENVKLRHLIHEMAGLEFISKEEARSASGFAEDRSHGPQK